MKCINFSILLLFVSLTINAQTADTIALQDVNTHIGKLVTIKCPIADFDWRTNALYLHIGNNYPNQVLSIIVKKAADGKPVKIDKDIVLGRKSVYFTGKLVMYDGVPDSTALINQAMLKREVERPQPAVIEYNGQTGTIRRIYEPRSGPIDLRGKPVIIIDDKKQVGKNKFPGL